MRLRVRFDHWLFRPTFMQKWDGITLYPWILLRQKREDVTDRLLRHEYQHVLQIDRMGWLPFYAVWLWQRLTKGYRNAPLEVEARAFENEPLTETQRERLGIE